MEKGRYCKWCLDQEPDRVNSNGHSPYLENEIVDEKDCECLCHEVKIKNKFGGERAVCPKCKELNSDSYEYLEKDYRNLKCSECSQESPFKDYFPINQKWHGENNG